jgi:uncharacterized protein with PQ loop repeat
MKSANEPGKIMFNQVLTTVYSANGLLAALVYLPQIRAIWNDASGAKSVSLLTWSVWATSSSVTLLYGWLVLHDRPMMVAAAVGTSGSLGVLAASLYRRRQAKV